MNLDQKSNVISRFVKHNQAFLEASKDILGDLTVISQLDFLTGLADGDFVGANSYLTAQSFSDMVATYVALQAILSDENNKYLAKLIKAVE